MGLANRSTVRTPRELPAGLSDDERGALSEFYAGRMTAGQLCERLAVAREGRGPSFLVDNQTSGFPARGGRREGSAPAPYGLGSRWRTWLLAMVVACAAGGAIGAVIGPLGSTVTGHPGTVGDSRVGSRTNQVRRIRDHAGVAVRRSATSQSAWVTTRTGVAVDPQARARSAVPRTRPVISTTASDPARD